MSNEYENYAENCHCGKKHQKGISCDVCNCAYHDGECYCTAENVAIGPHSAECSAETVCATFKEKQE